MPVIANRSMPTSVAAPVIQCQMRACVIQNSRRTFLRCAFCAAFSAAAFAASTDAFADMSEPSAIPIPDVRILSDAKCHSGRPHDPVSAASVTTRHF
jgi:hypothetical protein